MKYFDKKIAFILYALCFSYCCLYIPCSNAGTDDVQILIINSNASVEKYREVHDEFKKALSNPIQEIDLADAEVDVKKLTSYHPDLVYCIGTKAYHVATQHFADKNIVFSSIINWLRLPMTKKTYGISNELHPRMPIMMIRYVFPSIRKIGMLYSQQYTSEWFEKSKTQAAELDMEIIGKMISDKSQSVSTLKTLISETDALWLIPDPLVLPHKSSLYEILEICEQRKIPVLSYHDVFAKLGAVLIVAVDNPTIGRQAASIAQEILSGAQIDEKVQVPAGTHITLNIDKVESYGLPYNRDALGMINTIIKTDN